MTADTITLANWEQIHEYANRPGWIFRGHQKEGWELQTSIERCCNRHQIPPNERRATEDRIFREFRRIYHQYALHLPGRGAIVEWLSLMQHHGAPTRLLDFTYSVYVAAYFATEVAEGDCAIWAIDSPWLREQAMEILHANGKEQEIVARLSHRFNEEDEDVASKSFFSAPYVRAAWPINAFRLNERLRIQQGIFLVPGDVSQTFVENLDAIPEAKDRLIKIVVPSALISEARKQLFFMSISRTSLFPGLDGYAQSLGVYSPALKPLFDPVGTTTEPHDSMINIGSVH
ncbi:MAG TPA: hypothetical protein DDZ88_17300 [Verrucomicrobiales bacterium]|nr:hypothetical protein [Verrucomicrobiales bacterium]